MWKIGRERSRIFDSSEGHRGHMPKLVDGLSLKPALRRCNPPLLFFISITPWAGGMYL